MLRNNQPIQQHSLSESVQTGIIYAEIFPGLVSPMEEREASIAAHYNWAEWVGLEWQERATVVAQYRTARLVKLHVEDAMHRELKRRENQRKRQGNQGGLR